MLLKLKRTPGLYLVGFMGSGKSAVGRLLADELGWSFADIDEDIEKAQGVSIAEIFDTRGEEEFRSDRAGSAAQTRAGRGVRQDPWCWRWAAARSWIRPIARLLEERGVTVWLDCPFHSHQRAHGGTNASAAGARSREVPAAL